MKIINLYLMLLLLISVPSLADESPISGFGIDHRKARPLDYQACRLLVDEGKILSMGQLVKRVSSLTRGRVLDVVLMSDAGMYVYEIEVAGEDGVVRLVKINANDGSLISALEQ